MPYYEIQHTHHLGRSEREQIATAITNLHATTFNTPSLFVNVKFTSLKLSDSQPDFFIAGKACLSHNVIFAHVRSGTRSVAAFQDLAKKLEDSWDNAVKIQSRDSAEDLQSDASLRLNAVFIVPGLVAREAGLAIPEAGEEEKWLTDNMQVFEGRGKRNDRDMTTMQRS